MLYAKYLKFLGVVERRQYTFIICKQMPILALLQFVNIGAYKQNVNVCSSKNIKRKFCQLDQRKKTFKNIAWRGDNNIQHTTHIQTSRLLD